MRFSYVSAFTSLSRKTIPKTVALTRVAGESRNSFFGFSFGKCIRQLIRLLRSRPDETSGFAGLCSTFNAASHSSEIFSRFAAESQFRLHGEDVVYTPQRAPFKAIVARF